jgi:hypothetical protein
VDWEILLLVWIVGTPVGVLALAELLHRRRQRVRRAIAREGNPAQVIRFVPRPQPVAQASPAASAARAAAAVRRR